MLIVRLHPKKEGLLLKGHPWLFSGSVDRVQGEVGDGLCRVIDSGGRFVAHALYNPCSQIAIRVLSLEKGAIDSDFFARRIDAAIALRKQIIPEDTTCYRLINAEGDGLPGLVADIYGNVIVLQFLCPGMESFRDLVVDLLTARFDGAVIFERSDLRSRKTEGLKPVTGPLKGELANGEVEVMERGIPMVVDVFRGDRTGFYLDHRTNRARLQAMSEGKRVLDLFSYTGSFARSALAGGAESVVTVDSSPSAQPVLKRNRELAGGKPFTWQHEKEECSRWMNREKEQFDIVVCDPPSFTGGIRDYVQVNIQAMQHVKPGGMLFSSVSFAPQFDSREMHKLLSWASEKADRNVRLLEPLYQSADFPHVAGHPEGIHLFGHIISVD